MVDNMYQMWGKWGKWVEKCLKGLLKRGTRLAGNRTVVQGKSNPVGMAEFLADDPRIM